MKEYFTTPYGHGKKIQKYLKEKHKKQQKKKKTFELKLEPFLLDIIP